MTSLGPPRWRGERGRTEVWYLTFTDASSGWAGWIHGETVAPTGDAAPYAHGWTALFPPGADGHPLVERFGPGAVDARGGERWFAVDGVEIGADRWCGSTDSLHWDLALRGGGPPLYTFPKVVWERKLLPGAQVVPVPDARIDGTITAAGTTIDVDATGAVARIFGHGSAQRWGWLHAPLDDDGVLEIVTASAHRAGLRRVPPLAMVQLRHAGEDDWPGTPLLAAPRYRTRLAPDGFRVSGRAGGRRLTVDVSLPDTRSVTLRYEDPDGSTATCTNSEQASATVVLTADGATRRWTLDGTAHAEVGTRP